jgi:large subunit ribosomal protein L13
MAEKITRQTHKIDATGRPLGRLATEVATLLIGKNKPSYEPQIDAGDFVHISNIDKVKLTGNKIEQKKYYSHSQYPGGLKEVPMKKYVEQGMYDEILKRSVDKMLPKNKFRTPRLKRITFASTK